MAWFTVIKARAWFTENYIRKSSTMLFVFLLELFFFLSLQLNKAVVAQTCTHGSVRVVSYQCTKMYSKCCVN